MSCRFLSLVLLAGFANLGSQGPVLLRRSLKDGATETYRITSSVNMVIELPNGLGEQEINVDSEQTCGLLTSRLDPTKGALVRSTITFDKWKVDGPLPGGEEKPEPLKTEGWLNDRGILKPLKPKENGQVLGGFELSTLVSPFFELPEQKVKVGDSWKIAIPKNPLINQSQALVATLKGEKVIGEHPVWVVSLNAEIKLDTGKFTLPKETNGTPNPMAGQKASVTGLVRIEGEVDLDKVSCSVLHLEAKSVIKQQTTIEAYQMTVKSSTESKTTIDRA